ncbi:MAG: hypothetical protein IH949_01390 [Bacteroidetes bacterium]|nr:hypothetical protein [Bacteroidota bacterium]
MTEDLIPREGCCKVVRWFQMNVFPDNEYLDFSVTDELSLFRLPNTLHTSGECYKIYLTDAELENLTAEEHQELAKTPKEVPLLELEQIVPAVALERIWKKALRQDFPLLAKEKRRAKAKLKAKAKATGEKFSTVIKNDNNNNNGADEVDLHIAFLDGVPKGIRHNILVRLVGYYRTMRIAMEQVERMMLDWNLRCSPPREGREFLKELEQLLDDSQYINDDMYSENRIIATVEKGATPPTTILFLDGHELLFSKSVNTLQGTYGANKSFFASHIVAAILNPYKEQMFLGIEVNTSMEYSVLYVDTERTVADEYPYNVRSMLCLAGLNPKRMPPNFRALSFSTVQRQFRLDEIERILEGERKKDKHSLIVFDVISDLTSNFNDLHQCNRLLDKMNVLIEDNDITILGLIHVNYGTQKARGHVGSELVNKSKTAMGIGYAGGNDGKRKIIELEMIKTRFVKPRDKFYMKRIGRDEYQELVFADASEIAGIEQKKAPIDDIIKYLVDKNITEITRPELAARLRKSFGASKTTIVERLEMLEDKPYLFTAYKKVLEVSHGTRNTHIYRISEITDD